MNITLESELNAFLEAYPKWKSQLQKEEIDEIMDRPLKEITLGSILERLFVFLQSPLAQGLAERFARKEKDEAFIVDESKDDFDLGEVDFWRAWKGGGRKR